MCLCNPVRIQTENDIVCYKLFYQWYTPTLYSLFRDSQYTINKVKTTRAEMPKFRSRITHTKEKVYYIEKSALHSFATYGEAKEYLEKSGFAMSSVVIVKCIIPKDSKYIYKGTYVNYNAYASQKLKPVEINDYDDDNF